MQLFRDVIAYVFCYFIAMSCSRPTEVPSLLSRVTAKRRMISSSFTCHGLTAILHGDLYDRIIWTVLAIVSIMLALLLTWSLFTSYLKYTVSTSISMVYDLRYPTITVCDPVVDDMFNPRAMVGCVSPPDITKKGVTANANPNLFAIGGEVFFVRREYHISKRNNQTMLRYCQSRRGELLPKRTLC